MKWLLENQLFQQAVVALVVLLLGLLTKWVKSKVSHVDLVNDNWEYIQPVIDAMRKEAITIVNDKTGWSVEDIIKEGLVQFVDKYRSYEFKEPSTKLIAAVSDELEKALAYKG